MMKKMTVTMILAGLMTVAAGAVYADDMGMSKESAMSNDSMSHDGAMKKDSMSKDEMGPDGAGMSKDSMSK
jgi:pentapeptide MXKDX repeat protein